MWFVHSLKDLHQMLKWSRKSNSNFFDVNLPKEQSVQKIILFWVLPERLLIFKYGNWAQTVLLSKYRFNSENIKSLVWYDFAQEEKHPCHIMDDLSRNTFDFAAARRMLFCSQIRFLRMTKLLHQMLNRSVREVYNFLDVKLQRNLIFDSIRVLGIAHRAFNC